ncbi:hypothetical protein FF38_04043 [Lucilia cuprina]|uniref:Uncharacterized protein n=1 Tax=Lucilia cuprina TaxID=7375 RepID=A0A0L0CC30_LUCCU|nr:hypothetical protein FF38_04043 [Lucilia cuprina]
MTPGLLQYQVKVVLPILLGGLPWGTFSQFRVPGFELFEILDRCFRDTMVCDLNLNSLEENDVRRDLAFLQHQEKTAPDVGCDPSIGSVTSDCLHLCRIARVVEQGTPILDLNFHIHKLLPAYKIHNGSVVSCKEAQGVLQVKEDRRASLPLSFKDNQAALFALPSRVLRFTTALV